jgi:hypothetical protein
MLIKNKSTFVKGLLLLITFFIVLSIMLFSNFFGGENALKAADKLFNSIAKGSTNYFPGLIKKNEPYKGKTIDVTIKLKNEDMTQKASKILTAAGAEVKPQDQELAVKCDLGKTLEAALADSSAMFNNRDGELTSKYGFGGQEALFVWWNSFKQFDKSLKKQKNFADAKFVEEVVKKGIEVGYNFFKIDPQTAKAKAGVLTFSLIFYVIYTLWFGIAVLFLFEGFGLEMKKGARKEV